MTDALYAHRPLSAKLGIKAGWRVSVLGGPQRFASSLEALPPKVAFTAKAEVDCDLYLCFVSSRSQLSHRLATLPLLIGTHSLWIMWPKKASGLKVDIDGNVVRDAGLASGLVDYKICSVDATWSALAFKRRKGR